MEYVWLADPESFQGAGEIIPGAFADYSMRRLHSSIGCMPPAALAAKWSNEHKAGGVSFFMLRPVPIHGVRPTLAPAAPRWRSSLRADGFRTLV